MILAQFRVDSLLEAETGVRHGQQRGWDMHQARTSQEEPCQQPCDISSEPPSKCNDHGGPDGPFAQSLVAQLRHREQILCLLASLKGEERAGRNGGYAVPEGLCEVNR